ncbi:MAG: MarR family transcriptional regulator [Methanomicrobiales archaeon]|nr:MarR family transcriptional regulator [Methanomicrobiales archaeon]
MRDEEQDWLVYCQIAARERITVAELARVTGLARTAVEASAARLVRGMIVEREGESLRAMAVGESLAKCQANHCKSSPIVIENGVIRVRKEDG